MADSIFLSPAGGESLIHQATVVLTDAQIKTMTDPGVLFEVVEAPGANKILLIESVFMVSDLISGYVLPSNTGFLTVVYGEYLDDAATKCNADELLTVAGRFAYLLPLMGAPSVGHELDVYWGPVETLANSIDQALKVYAESPAPYTWTGGNIANTLTVTVAYLVLNLTTGLFE